MKNMAVTLTTTKKLFARSRNQCAFPGCCSKIVESDETITGQICHICARKKGGSRYKESLSLKERDEYDNLILLCSKHHKIIDSDPENYSEKKLFNYKKEHESQAISELTLSDSTLAKKLYANCVKISKTNTTSIEKAESVIIKTNRTKININHPEGSIGSDLIASNYIYHLAQRYNEFASKQPDRYKARPFSFSVIWTTLKHQFKAPSYQRIPISKFDEVVAFLQGKIDNTMQGRINKSRGIKNYSSFEEYKVS